MMERDHRTENVVAFAVREQSNNQERPTCKHCGKYGHDETMSYELVGYPSNWSSQRGRGRGGRGGRASRGGRTPAATGCGHGYGRKVAHVALAQPEIENPVALLGKDNNQFTFPI